MIDFSVLTLEPVKESTRRYYIAYSRGNPTLVGHDGSDIGGSLVFGGPVWSYREPEKSRLLKSFRGTKPFSDDYHVYEMKWEPSKLYNTMKKVAGLHI